MRLLKKKLKRQQWLSLTVLLCTLGALAPFGSSASTPRAVIEVNVQLAGFPEGTRITRARALTQNTPSLNPLCGNGSKTRIDVANLESGAFHIYGKYERGSFCEERLRAVRFEIVTLDSARGEIRLPVEILREKRAPASGRLVADDLRVRCGKRGDGPFECETVSETDVLVKKHWQAIVPDSSRTPDLRVQKLRIELTSDSSG